MSWPVPVSRARATAGVCPLRPQRLGPAQSQGGPPRVGGIRVGIRVIPTPPPDRSRCLCAGPARRTATTPPLNPLPRPGGCLCTCADTVTRARAHTHAHACARAPERRRAHASHARTPTSPAEKAQTLIKCWSTTEYRWFKRWSNAGPTLVKCCSNAGQIADQMLVNRCSNAGQTLIKRWSNRRLVVVKMLKKRWSKAGQMLVNRC